MINKLLFALACILPIFASANRRLFLMDILPKKSIGAEIGVWKGDFAFTLNKHLKPKKLYLIDPWLFRSEYPHTIYGGLDAKSQLAMDIIYQSVCKKFADCNNIHIKRMSAAKASLEIEDLSLDWVYIDGDHSYQGVLEDLRNYWDKVKPNGYVTGDDYNVKEGVRPAVKQFLIEKNIDHFVVKNSQFIIQKSE